MGAVNHRSVSILKRTLGVAIRVWVGKRISKSLESGRVVIVLLLIIIRTFSSRHTLGGLKGYKILEVGELNPLKVLGIIKCVKKKYMNTSLGVFKENNSHLTYLNENLNQEEPKQVRSELSIVGIFPGNWSRDIDGFGFPHLLHIQESAQKYRCKLKIMDLEQTMKALGKSHSAKLMKEIALSKPNLVFVSGHKNSFNKNYASFLSTVKRALSTKIVLILVDDWSEDYAKMVYDWRDVADFVLLYEYNSYVELKLSEVEFKPKLLIQPFPRATLVKKESKDFFGKKSIPRFVFVGSLYLNRLPWLFATSQYLKKHWPKVDLNIVNSNQPGAHILSIREYFEIYKSDLFTLHFLERTPEVYSFTSGIWDAFSHGSLVIAQTSKLQDPICDFFIPGKHYLRFSSITELCEILEFLCRNPLEGYEIAQCGHKFWKANYEGQHFFSKLQQGIS